jgi:hypothetical protein
MRILQASTSASGMSRLGIDYIVHERSPRAAIVTVSVMPNTEIVMV